MGSTAVRAVSRATRGGRAVSRGWKAVLRPGTGIPNIIKSDATPFLTPSGGPGVVGAKPAPAPTSTPAPAPAPASVEVVAPAELQTLKRKLQSLSYGSKGQDPHKLFSHYDRDNSGHLDFDEFRAAVRKGGHVTPAALSGSDLRKLFDGVDSDNSGDVSIAELTSFVWGSQIRLQSGHPDTSSAGKAAPPPSAVQGPAPRRVRDASRTKRRTHRRSRSRRHRGPFGQTPRPLAPRKSSSRDAGTRAGIR